MVRILSSITAVVVLAAACGSSEDTLRRELGDQGATEEQITCIFDGLEELGVDLGRVADDLSNDRPSSGAAATVINACLVGDEPSAQPGIAVPEGTDYGDDPRLDALWDACAEGEGESCDQLYFQAPDDSAYLDFGDTCGRRFLESPGLCSQVEGLDGDDEDDDTDEDEAPGAVGTAGT